MLQSQETTTQLDPIATDDSFASLLQKSFRPPTDERVTAITESVKTLGEWAVRHSNLLTEDAVTSIRALISEIDQMLTAQTNEILHCPEFQTLERSWRGLHFLVSRTEIDEKMKIRVMPLSKTDLRTTLRKFKGSAWDTSPLFKAIYEQEYGVLGGAPYGLLVGDYYFDHTPTDCETLRELSKIAAASHAPFVSAAESSVLGLESWQDLSAPRDLSAIFATAEYAAWTSLRKSDDARYLALTLPRFLGRTPYGAKNNPVDEFAFEEDTNGSDPSRFCWLNSAYGMAANITRAFTEYGWCTRIRGVESGGALEDLPTFTFPTDDGGVDLACPTEVAISDRREAELSKNGFMPLLHRKNTDVAAFIGAQSLQKPSAYDDPAATANAELSARLPYIMAVSRFAHYLKVMVRDKIGSNFNSPDELKRWLQRWLVRNYVHANPNSASDEAKARRPLAAAEVIVTEVEDNPGYYNAQFLLKPHYQLEGLTVSLRLVSKLNSAQT